MLSISTCDSRIHSGMFSNCMGDEVIPPVFVGILSMYVLNSKLDSHYDVWADFYQRLGGTLGPVGLRR